MRRSGATGQRLAAIFGLGCVLLNYPILSLFSRTEDVAGIPLLYVYVFAAWILLIGLLAFVIERPGD
jgi:predicted permease